jgi:drug/metabolite transporter (DMT)-like permease
MRQKLSWRTYVFCIYTVVAVTVLAIALIGRTQLLGLEPKIYFLCALLAVGPQIVGHGSFNFAVKYMSATLLGMLSLLEPIGAAAFARILFGEWPSPVALAGMAIVLVAVTTALLARHPTSAEIQAGAE